MFRSALCGVNEILRKGVDYSFGRGEWTGCAGKTSLHVTSQGVSKDLAIKARHRIRA